MADELTTVIEAPAVKGDYGDEQAALPPYTPGDHIVLVDGVGTPTLYHINDIQADGKAVLERVDSDLNPTGDLQSVALSDDTGLGTPEHFGQLQPMYVVNGESVDDNSFKAIDLEAFVLAYCKADTADPDKFAYVPDKDHPSTWKLPIGDAKHIRLAWQAVTKGMMGAKAQLGDALDSVKRKIKAAANALPDGDVKDSVLAYIDGKNADDEKKAIALVRECNIAAKSISDDGWRIGGYLVLYGDAKQTDLVGDWFTKATDYCLNHYKTIPLFYEHGQDKEVKTTTIGTIDKLEGDEYGVWMEAQLERANRYAKRVKELVGKGKAGLSSGSLAHIVRRVNNAISGEIERWPLAEGTVTVTPAEPRTLVVPIKHYIDAPILSVAYKSIGSSADRWLEGLTPEKGQENPNGDEPTSEPSAPADGNHLKSNPVEIEETMELTAEQLATIAKTVAEQLKPMFATPVEAPAPDPKVVAANGGGTQPTKALPASEGGLPQPAAIKTEPPAPKPNTIRVIGDRRFADYNAEDMSYLMDIYAGVTERTTQRAQSRGVRGYEYKPLELAAKNFFDDWRDDQDHKMQRLVSDKVLRGIAENRLDPNLVEFIPFPTKEAVEGNHYDPTAEQYAHEERLAAKMFDQGKSTKEIRDAVTALKNAYKSNELDNAGQTNFGAEWVPTIWNNEAWRRIRVNNPIAGLIMNVQMPSNPWNWPIESTDPTVFYVAEGTDAAQLVLGASNTLALSKAGTGKVAFTAKKLGSHIGFSVEENEDSIIPVIPIWRFQMTRALWNYVDDTIINGDTTTSASTNINLIDGTPTAGTAYLALDGMRKYALITNTAQLVDFGNVAPTMANLRAMQTKLSVHYQADFQNLAYVTNVGTYQKMKALPEFASYLNSGVMPPSVMGLLPNGSSAQATMGQVNPTAAPVGVIDGIPLYVSAQIGLSKSGAIGSNGGEISTTGSNNVDGSVLLFHRSRCVLGWRRAITSDVLATSVFSDTMQLWATARIAFNTFDTTSIALGYDIAQ